MSDRGEVDPDDLHTREEFRRALVALKKQAGMTVRQIARKTSQPSSTVGDYFSGTHLPRLSPASIFTDILAVCGVGDPHEVAGWRAALERVTRGTGRTTSPSPYRGLARFERDDTDWFFGRDEAIARLVAKVDARAATGGAVVVFGASGVGKSSLLRAGLLPAMESAWQVLVTTPVQGPVHIGDRGERPLLVVVDQAEELFTVVDPVDRDVWIDELTRTIGPGVVVVLGIRADFISQMIDHPLLIEFLRDEQELLDSMNADQVRSAITAPARKAGLDIEPGLVDLILRDLKSASRGVQSAAFAHDAGALPLLSHALHVTWRRGARGRLAIADYLEAGGIHDAVTATAEQVYGALGARQRAVARRLFVRLVNIGDGVVDTRRRVSRAELLAMEPAGTVGPVLEQFIEQRLVSVDADAVEIVHEVLVDAWPRLRSWLDEDRETLLVHRALATATQTWERSGRDPDTLYRGALLERACALREPAGRIGDLSPAEHEFLDAGQALLHAEGLGRRRRLRTLQRMVAVLAALLVLTTVTGVFAFRQRNDAREQRSEAQRQRDLAVSGLLAARATTMQNSDPTLAKQIALAAYRAAPTLQATSAVLGATRTPSAARTLGPSGVLQALAVSADGTLLAAGGTDHQVWLWPLGTDGRARGNGRALTEPAGEIFAVAIHPRGRELLAAGEKGVVDRWDLTDPASPRALSPLTGPTKPVHSLAISPDGQTVAAGSIDGTVYLWTMDADGARPQARLELGGEVRAVRFSTNGALLVAAGTGGTARLWRTEHLTTDVGIALTGADGTLLTAAFTPDGDLLAVGGQNKSVYLWSTTHPDRAPTVLSGHVSRVNTVAFSPDGTILATGSSDNTVRLYNARTKALLSVLPHPAAVTALQFAAAGRTLITTAGDAIVRCWPLPGPLLAEHGDAVFSVAFPAAGTSLATGTGKADGAVRILDATEPHTIAHRGESIFDSGATAPPVGAVDLSPQGTEVALGRADGSVEVWTIRDPDHPTLLGTRSPPTGQILETLAFSPDGALLAAAGDDNTVRLFDLRTTGAAVTVATLGGAGAGVFGVAFHPRKPLLAAASADKTVRIWDIGDPQAPRLLSTIAAHTNYVYSVAFSPRDDILATAGADATLRLWDIRDPARPAAVGEPLTGTAGAIITAVFSPDGTKLVAVGKDPQIWLWNVRDPHRPILFAAPIGPTGDIFAVDFAPDGASIAVGGADHTVSVMSTDIAATISWICSTTGSPVTAKEWAALVPDVAFAPPCP